MAGSRAAPATSSPAPVKSITSKKEHNASTDEKKSRQLSILHAHRQRWLAGNLVPLSRKQAEFPRDLPSRGPFWISRQVVPPAPDSFPSTQLSDAESQPRTLTDLVYDICIALKTHPSQCVTVPRRKARSVPVPVEWIAWREELRGDRRAKEPAGMSEDEKFARLDGEWQGGCGPTVMHVHGGGFYAGSPATFRALPNALAMPDLAHARICSTSYRLAPQEPFPAALIDVMTTYLSLLYPSAKSLNAAVDPSKLVLAADSAGANLALALVQILLYLQRQKQSPQQLQWHDGKIIDLSTIPLPSGILLTSPWLDLTTTSPSWQSSSNDIDILEVTQPPLLPEFPADAIWPTRPPRGHPYCETTSLDHPLVSPAAATNWHGTPPMFIGIGGAERPRDGARAVAYKAREQGVSVLYEEYENMPHDFAVVLVGKVPSASHCLRRIREACVDFLSGSRLESLARIYRMPNCEEGILDWKGLEPEGGWDRHVARMRLDAEEKTKQGPWRGPQKARI